MTTRSEHRRDDPRTPTMRRMPAMGEGPIGPHAAAFADRMTTILSQLSGKSPAVYRAEVVADVADLVAAIIDADGSFGEAELAAYVSGIGPMLDPPLTLAPAELRRRGTLTGKAVWLTRPSTLFDLLLRADRRDGVRRSHEYYALALELAHAVAAIGLPTSESELVAIDRFRSMLLDAMDAIGINRPGSASAAAAQPAAPATETPTETPAEPIEELLAELDQLIGLGAVKAEVRRLTSLLTVQRLRAERDLPVIETSHHLVFTGNPGTGKTTVARLLSRIYHSLGVVSGGHLVETDRSALVAGFVGQTAMKTRAVLEQALGGTLLIDEAYALARGGEHDFGREAIDTLVKFMEDHRDDLAIVAAGYPEEMATFIAANPGLQSRFTRTIHFDDYTTDELVAIFVSMGERLEYHLSDSALQALSLLVEAQPRDRGFGNARFVRNLFEAAVSRHAERVAPLTDPSTEQLVTLTVADITG